MCVCVYMCVSLEQREEGSIYVNLSRRGYNLMRVPVLLRPGSLGFSYPGGTCKVCRQALLGNHSAHMLRAIRTSLRVLIFFAMRSQHQEQKQIEIKRCEEKRN